MAEIQFWKIGLIVGVGSALYDHYMKLLRPGGGLRFLVGKDKNIQNSSCD